MSGEPGYCYVVLFSNGFAKGGKSKDIFRRYKAHKANSAAYGISVRRTFYTAPHFAYDDTEKRLLAALSEVAEGRVGEYFQGVTEDAALKAISALGFEVNYIEERMLGLPRHVFGKLYKDRELWGQPIAIFFYLMSKMDSENEVSIRQVDIARALDIDKHQTCKAIKKLVDKSVILKNPALGKTVGYKFNTQYGWKGEAGNV
ncbi:hypothetical protein [Methylomagnum ishizawai]|uniref:hypothetical protein n=1 Tax=Methylomagnum ishizawai TaxID=1760988 RepID=UPI001C340D33|nr:hypothetical protein [Methylomagnum ishizawai]BBL77418.1 hypothetical protein MishRS11D_45160 [Methylomagnum ishizawai]